MGLFSQVIKDISTCKDGESYDSGRVIWIIIALAFVGFSFYSYVVLKQAFEPVGFGGGSATILGGGGLGLKLKADTEPGEKQ